MRCIAVLLLAATTLACMTSEPHDEVERAAVATAEDGIPDCTLAPADRLGDGVVFIVPGEVVCVRLESDGSVAKPVELVATEDIGDILVLQSSLIEGAGTFLSVHNPFGSSLKYRAGLLVPGEQQFRATSSCTVLSKRFSMEHWPYAVAALALTDFQVLPEGDDSMVCE